MNCLLLCNALVLYSQQRVSLVIFCVGSGYLRHWAMFFSCVDNPKIGSKSEAKRAHLTGLSCDQNFVPILDEEEDIDGNYCETWEPRISQS